MIGNGYLSNLDIENKEYFLGYSSFSAILLFNLLRIGKFMFRYFIFYSGLLLAFSSMVSATEVETPGTLEGVSEDIISWAKFSFENDAFSILNKSDDGYSNGLLFFWGKSDYNNFSSIKIPNWMRTISDWTYINQGADKQYSLSYGISQLIYTPNELEESALIEEDRPYAGILLWDAKIRSYANNKANSLGLSLGVVGPASLAEQSQTIIHKLIGATIPKGWDNQIKNELLLRIEGEHIERFYVHSFSDYLSFDASSYSALGIGNLRSDIGTGLTMRFGNILDKTYATINPNSNNAMSGIKSTTNDKVYWQLFNTIYASYMFNDITLTGNTFTDSHSVDMIHEQIRFSFGSSILYHNWGATFSINRGNDQFKGQQTVSKYGSVTISYHY